MPTMMPTLIQPAPARVRQAAVRRGHRAAGADGASMTAEDAFDFVPPRFPAG